jgi:hypothetical protein
MTTTTTIDWPAADATAANLGLRTRQIVAERNAEAVKAWCLRMASEHGGGANALRSLSYFELAVLTGHREPEVTAGATLEWRDLLRSVETLAATVQVKIDAEKAAAEEAARSAALDKEEESDDDDE